LTTYNPAEAYAGELQIISHPGAPLASRWAKQYPTEQHDEGPPQADPQQAAALGCGCQVRDHADLVQGDQAIISPAMHRHNVKE
jgi:hypothetical protein